MSKRFEVRILDRLAKRENEELFGNKEDWESLKEREREGEDFKLFCSRRTSPENYALIFGEREQWPENTDWSEVESIFKSLYNAYRRMKGGDKND